MGLVHRSQALMRLPVDAVAVKLHLAGGETFDGSVFVALGDSVLAVVARADGFIPVAAAKGVRLVPRASIAAIVVPGARIVASDELPTEQQGVRVHLHSGAELAGELRWTAPENHRRTVDYLNETSPHLIVHAIEGITYVVKAHVAWIEEV
jgi:hypothetical protein